jgi:hypothetical protein
MITNRTGRFLATAGAFAVMGVAAQQAQAFWFFCDLYDLHTKAQDSRAKYSKVLEQADPLGQGEGYNQAKEDWDDSVEEIPEAAAEAAKNAPGTSLTGPPSIGGIIKGVLKSIFAELIGQATLSTTGGVPNSSANVLNGDYATPIRGSVETSLAFADLPVGEVFEANISNVRLSYVSPIEHGPDDMAAPPSAASLAPALVMVGNFSDVSLGAFTATSTIPWEPAYNGLTVTASDLASRIAAKPSARWAVMDSGLFTPALLSAIIDTNPTWDPNGLLTTNMRQISTIEITNIDAVTGLISGEFTSMAIPEAAWDNGVYDYQVATPSETGTSGPESRAADDFTLASGNGQDYMVHGLAAEVVSNSRLWGTAFAEVYASCGTGGPANEDPIAVLPAVGSTIVGTDVFGSRQVRRYVFDTAGLPALTPGTYWISVVGRGDFSGTDTASFASANHPNIRGRQAYVKNTDWGYPEWAPVEEVYGIATDLAFTVDAMQAGTALPPPQPEPCRADFNGDETVDVFDLLGYLDEWFGGC